MFEFIIDWLSGLSESELQIVFMGCMFAICGLIILVVHWRQLKDIEKEFSDYIREEERRQQ